VSGNVALNTGIRVHQPGSSNVIPRLVYDVLHDVLHLGVLVSKLVSERQPGKASADGGHAQFARLVTRLVVQGNVDFGPVGQRRVIAVDGDLLRCRNWYTFDGAIGLVVLLQGQGAIGHEADGGRRHFFFSLSE
jgi:hypothetical protein